MNLVDRGLKVVSLSEELKVTLRDLVDIADIYNFEAVNKMKLFLFSYKFFDMFAFNFVDGGKETKPI